MHRSPREGHPGKHYTQPSFDSKVKTYVSICQGQHGAVEYDLAVHDPNLKIILSRFKSRWKKGDQIIYCPSATGSGLPDWPWSVQLLRKAGYPDADILFEELTTGFEMVGRLTPGCGWTFRTDGRYSSPISMEEFHNLNKQYVHDKLRTARPSQHWQAMLDELIEEKKKGRVDGPLQAPKDWERELNSAEGMELSPAPTQHAWAGAKRQGTSMRRLPKELPQRNSTGRRLPTLQ